MSNLKWLGQRLRPARRFRPALEALEDRTVPTTLQVTNLNDSGAGSLRQAIFNANNEGANPGSDTIVFTAAAAGGTINLTTPGGTQFGPNALEVTSTIVILGSGETIARGAGAASFRLFFVSAAGNLTLRDVTLQNGLAQGGNGGSNGGQDGGGGGGGLGAGGAIYNKGTLSIGRSTLTANTARGGNGGNGGNLTGFNTGGGGGGGGMGGSGGNVPNLNQTNINGGGGGGGVSGNGGPGGDAAGGGGGGTTANGAVSTEGIINGGAGGASNGGNGGGNVGNGQAGGIGGGGGGGGNEGNGGNGGSGGGGGGGGQNADATANNPGSGGFGGGGGGGGQDANGGNGGFGGGGGGGNRKTLLANAAGGTAGFNAGIGGAPGATAGSGGGGGGAGLGGAIFNDAGTVTITNSTLSGNSALGGTGGSGTALALNGANGTGSGGGVFSRSGTLTVLSSTMTLNIAQAGRGIDSNGGGATATVLTMHNTILGQADTNQTDYDGTATGGGSNNLIGSRFGPAVFPGLIFADPLLGPLQNNGGLTFTHLPGAGSPALNAGNNAQATNNIDQRQFGPRIAGGTIDIGAVEVGASQIVAAPPVVPPPPVRARGVLARLVVRKLKKQKVLFLVISFSDTGEVKREIRSPFQSNQYRNIFAVAQDSDGDGVPDSVILSGKKGKKMLSLILNG